MNPSGKSIWITGASSGIGEALARKFSALGCSLVLSGRNKEKLQALCKELGCDKTRVLAFDLADTDISREEIVNNAWASFGGIDILINNGGVSQRLTSTETSETMLRNLMETNFLSHAEIGRLVAIRMMAQGGGKIVVISSIAGKFGFYFRSGYSAAKHALHGYFESLRLECESRGISVLMVCPGKIKTSVSLNALGKSGEPHGIMDASHARAMEPSVCADKIVEAIESNREEIFIGGKELLMPLLRQWFPPLFRFLLRRVRKD
jgi:dehydrogenase/reductase SDR family protein 7B